MTRLLSLALAFAGLGVGLCAAQTTGQGAVTPSAPSAVGARVDPTFGMLQRHVAEFGRHGPLFGPTGLADTVDLSGAGAVLRFQRPLTTGELAALTREGVRFRQHQGEVVGLDGIYPVWLPFAALPTLSDDALLLRAECAWRPRTLRPLETVTVDLGAAAAHHRVTGAIDGTGTLMATLDSGVDTLHPHLFFADGGSYAWIDLNEDGRWRAGDDGVDLDGDGTIGDDERLELLEGARLDYGMRRPTGLNGVLDVGVDWLYVDEDGDMTRDVGREGGFNEADPAYGEPIFVVDDVNGDGILGVNERLVRLKTSKLRKLTYSDRVYTRGNSRGLGLIDAVLDSGHADSSHGTAVASILVGGQVGYHTRVGVAPGAELISYSNSDRNDDLGSPDEVTFILDALREGAIGIVHEWTDPFGSAQDGSGNVEATMDSARSRGLAQINPLGNLNMAGKHLERSVSAGQDLNLPFDIGRGFMGQAYTVVYATLMWTGRPNPTFTMVAPNGDRHQTGPNQTVDMGGGNYFAWTEERSLRDTKVLHFYLYRADAQDRTGLPEGQWEVELAGFSEASTVFGRITDQITSWNEGVGWTHPTVDRGTLVYPSTADSAFGVAAYGGVNPQDTPVGALRTYSGRGPRMDGAPSVDLAGPDDPLAAMTSTEQTRGAGQGRSWFSTFGGTSGAGPHVAAAFALLAQQHPRWMPDDFERHLAERALRDDLSPPLDTAPDEHWGYGKLDVWAALYDEPRHFDNVSPMATLAVWGEGDDIIFDASGTDDADGDDLWFRFDVDYDGEWDTEWQQASQFTLSMPPAAEAIARVEVRDDWGGHHGALVPYEPAALSPQPEPDAAIVLDMGAPDAGADAGTAPVTSGDDSGGGCSQSGGLPAPMALLLAPFALLALRRRR